MGRPEVGRAEVGIAEVGRAEVGIAEVGIAEVGFFAFGIIIQPCEMLFQYLIQCFFCNFTWFHNSSPKYSNFTEMSLSRIKPIKRVIACRSLISRFLWSSYSFLLGQGLVKDDLCSLSATTSRVKSSRILHVKVRFIKRPVALPWLVAILKIQSVGLAPISLMRDLFLKFRMYFLSIDLLLRFE